MKLYLPFEEKRIISANRQDRRRFIIATKCRASMDPTDVNCQGLSRRHIIESCEASLERLKTNYIDLYQVTSIMSKIEKYFLFWKLKIHEF